jgi:AmmeMemoRadiSam system protein B
VTTIRRPTAAGTFYPARPEKLRAAVRSFLNAVPGPAAAVPKALIAPHAGYRYSGPIAASAYACLAPARGAVRRVVLLGTAHTPVVGLAASGADGFATPLGDVPVDRAAFARVLDLPQVHFDDDAHAVDHALEVQLPFLQVVLGEFTVVPFLVGRCATDEVAEVLDELWGGPETVMVVSSDLSHYHSYDDAGRLDRATAEAVEALRPDGIGPDQACGHAAVRGLLLAARRRGLGAVTANLRNSADTAGPREAVVGYGAFAFVEPQHGPRASIT